MLLSISALTSLNSKLYKQPSLPILKILLLDIKLDVVITPGKYICL